MRQAGLTLAVIGALLCAGPVLAQSEGEPEVISAAGDGPYVLPGQNRDWTALGISDALTPTSIRVEAGGEVTIAAVGDIPAFTVPLRPRITGPAADDLPLDPDARLLVLADTHGEYEIVVEFLRRQGVVDDRLHWSFGDGQMVVVGDIFDRGARQLEILWLFYRLQAEAEAAGGQLHVLLGNHENMLLRADLRYLHPRYPETARILGVERYTDLFPADSLLGDWLRSRPAVLRLGDLLLLHGGISPQVVEAGLTLGDLNAAVLRSVDTPVARRTELDSRTALVVGSFGPLWFRGYFAEQATAERPHMSVDQVRRSLEFYGVERILVGHTVVEAVTPFYDGAVIAVQVYPHRDEQTGQPVLEGVLREGGRWFAVNAQGGRRPLAVGPDSPTGS